MIFATVGTQLPFPRLLRALNNVAERNGLTIVAQTKEPTGHYPHLEAHANLEPQLFDRLMENAEIVVGHAGIGTILGARRFGKPLILFPRLAVLGEHRNDHQKATVAALAGRRGLYVAEDEAALSELLTAESLEPLSSDPVSSKQELLGRVRSFIAAD